MSQSFSCHCEERKKPVDQRAWEVWQRSQHRSAFAGYRPTSSDYSTVFCRKCGAQGRTKAEYVDDLPDKKWGEA
jgi:hypothetical protein